MNVAIALLLLYTLLPFAGLYTFSRAEQNIYGEAIPMAPSYAIHIVIVFAITFFLIYLKKNKKELGGKRPLYSIATVQRVFKRCRNVLFFCIAIMFYYGAGSILSGDLGRGDFRVTLGFLGFFYIFVSLFAPAGCIIFASAVYLNAPKTKLLSRYLVFIYVLAVLIGLLTGYKFSALLIITGGLIIISPRLNFTRMFVIALIIVLLMGWSASYFMGLDAETAFGYLFARLTSVAVEGTVGIWNLFENGGPEASYSLLYALGNKLASLVLSAPVDSVDFLKVNLTRYIGYLTYPLADEAVSGAFNLTVTNFGEAIYFFGKNYFFIYSIFSGVVIGFALRALKGKLSPIRNEAHLTFLTTYISTVLYPWVMNSNVGNLFGLPTLIYLFLLYLIIKYCARPINYSAAIRMPVKNIEAAGGGVE